MQYDIWQIILTASKTQRSTKGAPARGAGVLMSEHNDWFNITKVYDRIAATMEMDLCSVNTDKYVVMDLFLEILLLACLLCFVIL